MGSSNNGPTCVSSIPNVQPPTFIVQSCVGGQCSCVASNASIGPFSETKTGPVANSSQNADIHASPAWSGRRDGELVRARLHADFGEIRLNVAGFLRNPRS